MCNPCCVIIGYFIEDLLKQQNSALLALTSSYGFTQLVRVPQGTLIDHVYYWNQYTNPNSSKCIQMQDTYYSDHYAVVYHYVISK